MAKKKSAASKSKSSSSDWRAATLTEVRRLIQAADPEIIEERKWVKPTNPDGVPTWSHAGIVCTGETYKEVVKLTFARGAALESQELFNSSLEGNTRRAIDIREGESLDAEAFQDLIQAAVAANLQANAPKPKVEKKLTGMAKTKAKPNNLPRNEQGVVLLSGGNPQIAKADGNAPVQAYIAAMPGWKSALGKRIDDLVVRAVPSVKKAVRWNSPFYGVEGKGWFLTFHVLTKYVKFTFFKGAALKPMPPGSGKDKDARWIDIFEDDEIDEAQFTKWVKQAAANPGWDLGKS